MDNKRLMQLVREFGVLAIESIHIQYKDDDESTLMTITEVYEVWAREPDCLLSHMFLGYCLGEGEDVNAFSPHDLHLAVMATAETNSSTVEFDWLGDLDATSKPH